VHHEKKQKLKDHSFAYLLQRRRSAVVHRMGECCVMGETRLHS